MPTAKKSVLIAGVVLSNMVALAGCYPPQSGAPAATVPGPVPTEAPAAAAAAPAPTEAVVAVTPEPSPAAAEPYLAGQWEGKLAVPGAGLEILVAFAEQEGELVGAIDVPAQGAYGIPLHDIEFDYPRLAFAMLEGPQMGVFEGELMPDGSIAGRFSQSGVAGRFELQRPVEESAEPPPYGEEEVSFANGDVTLAGTLTLPEGDGPFPAVVLLTGSGQQNRDEELPIVPGYRPFRDIADHLTRQGFAVLRYDDRGVGGSSGDLATATTADFAQDAEAAFNYLVRRPEVEGARVGLLGHSEGAIIAAMLAARNPEVAFVVSMAGPSTRGYDLLLKQVERLVLASGGSAEEAAAAAAEQRVILDLVMAKDWDGLEAKVTELLQGQVAALPEQQRALIDDVDAFVQQRVAQQLEVLQSPWYQFFLAHDPGADWARVTVPVLALFGTLDAQVDAEQNRAALEAIMAEAGNQDLTVAVLPTANHLFQDAQTGAVEEYSMLPAELVPGLLETIGDWLAALK
ncbi:MAG: alpha/beta hydrolase family protein [Anaerolineae bacterium]